MFEILKTIFYGIVEGISEWLPISSTGHLILFEEIFPLAQSDEFMNMFRVVIQLGAIMAVVVIYFWKLWPLTRHPQTNQIVIKKSTLDLWLKIVVACIPAAIIGLLFDDVIDQYLMNWQTVSIMLILFGIGFLFIENNKQSHFRVNKLSEITYKDALIIGIFQLIAAIFPGTSRSGATILGGILIGLNRTIATEFTFFLAVPVMFGASLLKIVKFGLNFTAAEFGTLLLGSVVSFVVSILAIKFLLAYIKKNDFKVFGYYRIALGIIVILFFVLFK